MEVPLGPWTAETGRTIQRLLRAIAKPKIYTVATLPDPAVSIAVQVYVSDEAGGATLAFSDGSDWRRVQDRAVVS